MQLSLPRTPLLWAGPLWQQQPRTAAEPCLVLRLAACTSHLY